MAAGSKLEQHIQTVVAALATAAVSWLAYTVQENNVKLAVLADKVDRLEQRSYATSYTPPAAPVPQPELPVPELHALPASFTDPLKLRK